MREMPNSRHSRYLLAIQNTRNEFETLVHEVTLLPGTFALLAKAKSVTHVSGMNCHPSLGKDISQSMVHSNSGETAFVLALIKRKAGL